MAEQVGFDPDTGLMLADAPKKVEQPNLLDDSKYQLIVLAVCSMLACIYLLSCCG